MAGQEVKTKYDEFLRHLRGIQYIVINCCHGGFSLSKEACLMYLDLAGIDYTLKDQPDREQQIKYGSMVVVEGYEFEGRDIDRNDPALVKVVRTLGDKANGKYARLKIVEVPAKVQWQIHDYDGREWVAEVHRTWS